MPLFTVEMNIIITALYNYINHVGDNDSVNVKLIVYCIIINYNKYSIDGV